MIGNSARSINLSEAAWSRVWWAGFIALFCGTYLLKPITDPDFFWHLAHGQWLWANGSLPKTDPFAFSPGALDVRQHFILTSYWLSQLLYHLIYSCSGWFGFFVLKGVFFLGLLLALRAREHTRPLLHAIASSLILVIIFHRFPTERPQFFSFLAFAVLLVLFERLIDRDSRKINYKVASCLPLLLLVWSNLHAGVTVGQIFCVFAMLHYAWLCKLGELEKKLMVTCVLIFGLSLGVSFVNPNGYSWFQALNEISSDKYRLFFATTPEYDSIFTAIFKRSVYVYVFFIVFAGIALVGLVNKNFKSHALLFFLLLAFAWAALSSVRYLPFLGILSVPYVTHFLSRFEKATAHTLLLGLFCLCLFFARNGLYNYKTIQENGPISNLFPVSAVDFLRNEGVEGRGLNFFVWGGYLMFALGENSKVFVDGRTLYLENYEDYVTIGSLQNTIGSVEKLKSILNKYDFNYTIFPKIYKGETVFVNRALSHIGGWRLIYDKNNVVIFVREGKVG